MSAKGSGFPTLSPPGCAALVAGAELPSLHDQRDLILDTAASHDAVLVEGVGGVAVNLSKAFGLLDIAGQVREAGLPVQWIVVARASLATLNHSTLTVRAIRDHGFCVQGIVIGFWPATPGRPSCTTVTVSRPMPAYPSSVPFLKAPPPFRRQTSVHMLPAGSGSIADH